jgi:hypothetical protein
MSSFFENYFMSTLLYSTGNIFQAININSLLQLQYFLINSFALL